MKPLRRKPKTLAEKIISDILEKGLGDSTWAEKYPDAYDELFLYEKDMAIHADKIIKRAKKK
jgi:hypothetical protein